jgi:3-oxoadipate enol-lactonase / 4-carboxymuconolactone decarboxylase
MLLGTDPEGYAAAAEAIAAADLTEATATLRLPAFVLVGDRDEATPLGHAEALRAAIPGARLRLIGGAAHIPTLEQPRLVTEALLDFLQPATV